MSKATLYYVYDPMCSWCWGYHITWTKLQDLLSKQFAEQLQIQYVLGGLAPDNNAPMADELQLFLQQTWSRIHDQLGTEFNFDFWSECEPKRSTYPACRALLVARQQGLEKNMYHAIQQAYYLQAKNPSEISTLVALAEQVGLDPVLFENSINSDSIKLQLNDEITMARQLPIQGFPSLALRINGQHHAIELDYVQAENTLKQIQALLK
ncbi:DsbA family protein [Psychromonas sp. Urea-02u-13]|uniref:DsbA family protein n=1 Tax=Psychromonas sp. Urea-02u-13 TaxID=2058326 RepID=UPI000C3331AC|nr:DsbA family protein [Psychromonas sp. Urea-02u-13]PKG38107.1 DsbA family protein [Psychromonas sp. Urea-02u-13]